MTKENTLQELRQLIKDEVRHITPFDTLEQDHIDNVVAWIESDADLFRVKKPDKPPKHLVSYFVLVDPASESLLLVDHIKAQLWLPTGGHVAVNEFPKDTVIREANEELCQRAVFLRNNDHPFFVTVTGTVGLTPGHIDVSLWYLLRGDRYKALSFDNGEFNDVEWFTFDEVLESNPAIFDPHMQRFTTKLVGYLNR